MVQGHRKQLVVALAVHRGVSADPSARSAEKFFHLHVSVVWIGSRSTFVLCTALLTARLSLSDVLELAILWALLTVTITL